MIRDPSDQMANPSEPFTIEANEVSMTERTILVRQTIQITHNKYARAEISIDLILKGWARSTCRYYRTLAVTIEWSECCDTLSRAFVVRSGSHFSDHACIENNNKRLALYQ